MIKVSDITQRVVTQYLRVEKQYLNIMNSTISHEMRNPLNAILDHNLKQKDYFKELTTELMSVVNSDLITS